MARLKKRSLETKARISRMKRAEKRREQILYLKTQAEEMEILWYANVFLAYQLTLTLNKNFRNPMSKVTSSIKYCNH